MTARIALTQRLGNVGRLAVAVLLLCGAIYAMLAMAGTLPNASAQPPTVPTDAQGYVNSSARCDPRQTAVVVGRTTLSMVAICTDGKGRFEYRGMRLSDRAAVTLPATPMANGCFGVRSDNVFYTVSERKLLLTSGLRILRDEPMVEFKDFRDTAVTPVSNRTTSLG